MTDTLFSICNTAILFFWSLLLGFPTKKITQQLMEFPWVPLGLSFFYAYFLFGFGGLAEADFTQLEGIVRLFRNTTPESAAAGWLHYLAFDFWVGARLLKHSQEKQINHAWMVLPLLCTFMLGPMGVLAYSLVYWGHTYTRKHHE